MTAPDLTCREPITTEPWWPRCGLALRAVVDGNGQPIVYVCPLHRTQYTPDGELIGRPDDWRQRLTAANDFTAAARRLQATADGVGSAEDNTQPKERP